MLILEVNAVKICINIGKFGFLYSVISGCFDIHAQPIFLFLRKYYKVDICVLIMIEKSNVMKMIFMFFSF